MTDAFVSPVTGELVEASEAALAAALLETDEELGRLYRASAPLWERYSELQGPMVLPKRRYQTDKQSKVDRCPRCSARLHHPDSKAAA